MELSFTGMLFYGLILVSINYEVGAALSCYQCVDMEEMPDSTIDCDNPGDELLTVCDEGIAQCMLFEGVMTRPNGASQAGVARLCGPPPGAIPNTTIPENQCYCDQDAAHWLEVLIPIIAPDDLTVEGGFCFCNEDSCNRRNSTEDVCPHDDEHVHPTDGDGNATGHERALLWLIAMGVGFSWFSVGLFTIF
ncbi:uncharacterized protein LOC119735433 [Patiria miniata]|uniref:Protein quiver n=1 Tax=Patiria miniata TaxID=46514 RepID=A0A914ANI5_PATMI|nr:uncharacterized protein LOC119735433 [Patiria miniata]